MKFGPFTMSAARAIERKLTSSGVSYRVEKDQELLEALEKEWKEKPRVSSHQGPEYDPAFLFLEVEPSEADRSRELMAEIGFVTHAEEPDFSKEEYVCPSCRKVKAEEPGMCSIHREMLIPWSEFVKLKREARDASASFSPETVKWILIFGGLVIAFWVFWSKKT